MAKQEAELEKQRQLEVSRAEQELKKQVEGEAANLKKGTELALTKAKQELEKQRLLEVARAEQELKEQTERETAKLEKEKELALAEVALKHKADLAAQKSALEEENAKVLSEKEQAFNLFRYFRQ